MLQKRKIIVGDAPLTVEDVYALAYQKATLELTSKAQFWEKIERSLNKFNEHLNRGDKIYGVTTGYGDSCIRDVDKAQWTQLSINLMRFHGCGLGDILDAPQTRAVMVTRLLSLCYGYSAVTPDLIRLLAGLIQNDILPCIPQEGSVGASGDLTPLSYVVAVLVGERDVIVDGVRQKASVALENAGLKPLTLQPKEALGVMNGTAVMTGLNVLNFCDSVYMAKLACRLTALAGISLRGSPEHFSARLFAAKPHPGQAQAAALVAYDMDEGKAYLRRPRIQDHYSIRCAPHIIGVLLDAAPLMRRLIETELNSANDNPLIDPETGDILHGGHFYGGHMAFVADSLKTMVANLGDLMDRQMALLVDGRYNEGLPIGLSGVGEKEAALHHGLKAVQIGVSAWTAEALKLTMPASVFSRSTECHNQDKVSMGTIASRDCLRILTLTRQVGAGLILALRQAIEIRHQTKILDRNKLPQDLLAFIQSLNKIVNFVQEDRPLEGDLRELCRLMEGQELSIVTDL